MRLVANGSIVEATTEKRRRIQLVQFCCNLRIPFDLSRLRQIVIILVVRLLSENVEFPIRQSSSVSASYEAHPLPTYGPSSEGEIETYWRAAARTSPANQSNRRLLPYLASTASVPTTSNSRFLASRAPCRSSIKRSVPCCSNARVIASASPPSR